MDKHSIEFKDKNNIKFESYNTEYSIIKPYVEENQTINYQFYVNKMDRKNKDIIPHNSGNYEINKHVSIILPEHNNWILNIVLSKRISESLIDKYKKIFILDETNNTIENIPYDEINKIKVYLKYIGQKRDINEINIFEFINYIVPFLVDKESIKLVEYQKQIFNIAKLIITDKRLLYNFKEKSGFKRLVNQVIELNRNIYYNNILPNIEHYYLTDKIDGQRCMCILTEYSDGIDIKLLSNKLFKLDKYNHNSDGSKKLTIFDCELLYSGELTTEDSFNLVSDKVKLNLFDIIIFEDENISSKPFEDRFLFLNKAEIKIKDLNLGNIKRFIKLTSNYKKEIKQFYDDSLKLDYEIDGLIFTPSSQISTLAIHKNNYTVNSNYNNMVAYKWKPPHLLTIDFYIAKLPKSDYNKEPYSSLKTSKNVYILCNGINKREFDKIRMHYIDNYINIIPEVYHNKDYFPIQFSPSDNPYAYIYVSDGDNLENKIGEFRYHTKEQKWEMLKFRTDRDVELARGEYYGNALRISELIWLNIKNPIEFDELVNSDSEKYFMVDNNNIYKAQRNFNSFVKTKVLETIIDNKLSDKNEKKWIIDLAAGKGQDLARIINMDFDNGLFVDIDGDALYELVERKYNIKNQQKFMKVFTKQLDLSNDYKELLNKLSNIPIPKEGVDVIICNFAIHYFINNEKNLMNLINLVNSLLKENGRFMFTCFNGDKVFNNLKDSDIWELVEDNNVKYSIKKQFKSKQLLEYNQDVGVLLPFSKGKYYTEFLVNLEHVLNKFESNGFNIEISNSFGTLLDQFKKDNNKIYKELTDNDKEYVSLYQFNIMKKTKDKNNNNILKVLDIEKDIDI